MPILVDSCPVIMPNKDQKVCKYIDLAKFLSLLSTKALFFCRLDKLEDEFEGTTSKNNYLKRLKWILDAREHMTAPFTPDQIHEEIKSMYDFDKEVKEVNCVCCWNKADSESAALWKIYSDYGKGIMIKSTVDDIFKAFETTPQEIRISEINYLDYSNDMMLDFNTIYPIIHKQKAYEYEKEIRLIYEVDSPQIGKKFDWKKEQICEGKLLSVDLNILIDEIVVGPFSPRWMFDLIVDIAAKFGLGKTITRSNLTYTERTSY